MPSDSWRDWAPPTRELPHRRRPWRYRPEPLVKELGDAVHKGPSMRTESGRSLLGYHISEATQAPRRPRHWRWLQYVAAALVIFTVFIVAFQTF